MIAPQPPRRVRLPNATTTRPVTVNLLRQTLARLYLAAEAMSVTIDEIDTESVDFPDEARVRWNALADEWIRRFVNGDFDPPHPPRTPSP